MNKIIIALTILIVILNSGCQLPVIFASPTRHERTIAAEYDLTKNKKQKILVVVDSADWSNVPYDLKNKLTKSLNAGLKERLGFNKKYIIDFKNEEDFLKGENQASQMLAYNIGKKAGADFVLLVELYDFETLKVTETSYYKAEVSGKTALFDIKNLEKIWPVDERAKFIRVGFDIEQGGYENVTNRLAGSFAHCTVRYLYDCPVAKYKHFDDRSMSQLEQFDGMF